MKIYISGPISDICKKTAAKNFKIAGDMIQELGHEPMSPLTIPPPSRECTEHEEWLYYMKKSVKMMMDCDAMLCLEDWNKSRGAQLERKLFFDLGLPVFYYHSVKEMIQHKSPDMEWLHE
jgi:nucleoside 2-deoxyribosyltransferase